MDPALVTSSFSLRLVSAQHKNEWGRQLSGFLCFLCLRSKCCWRTIAGHTSVSLTTHSSTCRAVKCHCCFCSLSTEEASLRWQMILIILDVNWWGRRTITQRAFYYKPWLPKLWTTEYCTCGLSSNQPLWKVTDFINLRKNFSTWKSCSLFWRHEEKKQVIYYRFPTAHTFLVCVVVLMCYNRMIGALLERFHLFLSI